MKKFHLIWYDQEGEKKRDEVTADSKEDAEKKGYLLYNGNPPAKLLSIVPA